MDHGGTNMTSHLGQLIDACTWIFAGGSFDGTACWRIRAEMIGLDRLGQVVLLGLMNGS